MKFGIDSTEWAQVEQRLRSAVSLDRRLPELVFQSSYRDFQFVEFEITMADYFWPVLRNLMRASEDERLSLVVLEPDPVHYFCAHFGRYGALRFDLRNTSDDYYDALAAEPEGSPADALLYNSRVVVWVPDSMQWAIWGERHAGVAVIAARRELGATLRQRLEGAGAAIWSIDEALNYVSLSFRDPNALAAYSRTFQAVYGGTGLPNA